VDNSLTDDARFNGQSVVTCIENKKHIYQRIRDNERVNEILSEKYFPHGKG
jgi:hypothetical protein